MYDAIVILGKASHENGQPDVILRDRVSKGIEIARMNPTAKIIFSGGTAHWINDKSICEADIMYEYAKKIYPEINQSLVILEKSGNSTINQLVTIKLNIAIPQKLKRIALVTDEAHMRRAESIMTHIFGSEFSIRGEASRLDIAGGWRSLIMEREDDAYELTKRTRLDVITVGDHETWLKLEKEFQQEFKHKMDKGLSASKVIQGLFTEKP